VMSRRAHAKKQRRKEDRRGKYCHRISGAVLECGVVVPGRKHERSEASSARELRGLRPSQALGIRH
jgi:hypothetical protein